jgi:glutathione synthase/RimK-type ligase-like ATP-grasp enzyme
VNKYDSSSRSSKWLKTKWLLTHRKLSKQVPKTSLFNRTNLTKMLQRYPTVFFKPINGSGGANIIRIKRTDTGYQTQLNKHKETFANAELLYNKLHRFTNKRTYLLQRGIKLAKTNGNPFDIRVMVQKTNVGEWVSTAIFTKIGKPGKVATNYNQGGRIGYLSPTMSGAGFDQASIQSMESKLKKMGVTVGKHFDRQHKGFRELGLDVALDSKGTPWILEVNTRPQFYPLKNMGNRKMYKRILSYSTKYGRTK